MTRPEPIESMEMREKIISILHWIRVLIVAMFIVCSRFTVCHTHTFCSFPFWWFRFSFSLSPFLATWSFLLLFSAFILFSMSTCHFDYHIFSHEKRAHCLCAIAPCRTGQSKKKRRRNVAYSCANLVTVFRQNIQSSFVPHVDVSGRLKRRNRKGNQQQYVGNIWYAIQTFCFHSLWFRSKSCERETGVGYWPPCTPNSMNRVVFRCFYFTCVNRDNHFEIICLTLSAWPSSSFSSSSFVNAYTLFHTNVCVCVSHWCSCFHVFSLSYFLCC